MSKYSFKATAVATAVSGALMAATASAALPTNEGLNKAYQLSQESAATIVEEKRAEAVLVVLKQTTAADLMEQGKYTVDAARATYAAIEQAQADVSENLLKLDANAKVYGSTKLLAPTLIVDATDEALDALMLSGKVARILPLRDYDLHVADVNEYIKAASVNAGGNTAAGQKVAVLDTGIDYTHAVFGGAGTVEAYNAAQEDATSVTWPQGQVVGGYDFIRDDADPIENDPSFEGSEGSATSHGTSVSHSVTGIAPDVELLVYSVCGGGCPSAAQIGALEAAMDPNGDGDISDRADVINMSLGGEFGDTWTQDGTQYLIQRAVRLGTNVVISAGNDGDHPFRIGGPSTTPNALSVGAMTHPVTQNITTTDASLNDAAIEFGTASFGPEGTFTFNSEGKEFVYPDANQIACEDFADDVDFTGKVVLIDRGGCGFSDKVLRAQAKGAEFVIIVNSADAGVINMGPSAGAEAVTIRSIMLTKADGQAIKDSLAAGTEFALNVETGTLNIAGNAVAGFSSRGPSMDGLLKPEITAPGSAIMVADTGTQTGLAPASGTSFSGPITAGAVALVREARPELSSHEVKAVLMNTADLNVLKESTTLNPDTGLAPISLIGAGLVDVEKAIASPVVAMVHQPEYDTKQAALSFGFDVLEEVTSYTKTVEVNNHSDEDKLYELSIQPRFQNDAEAGAASWDFPSEVKVPANSSIEFEVTVSIDPAKLPTWLLENPQSADDLAPRADALTLAELDGALVFNDLESAGDHSLHLVYHVLPKAFVGGEVDVVEMADEKAIAITNTGFEPLSLSAQMLVGQDDNTDKAHNVKSSSVHLYGVSFCESGILVAATAQLSDNYTHLRQVGVEFMFDGNNDGSYDYAIGMFNDVGRSAIAPGRTRTMGGEVVDGVAQYVVDGRVSITGAAFHTTGSDSVTLSVCSERLGLTLDNIGDRINVAAVVGYPGYQLGLWSATDALEGSIPFAQNPARFVDAAGNEIDELAAGESAYVMSDWPVSISHGISQVVTAVDHNMIEEVIESRDNNAPVVDMHQQFYVDENVALGTVIGVLAHSDVDGDIVEFVVDGTGLVSVNSRGEIIVEGEIDFEYERNFRFDVTAVDAKGNTSEAVEVEVRVNNVKGGDDNDDNDNSGSLAWLALLAAPFAALRRRKQK
jgi:subtilisin family serine protease